MLFGYVNYFAVVLCGVCVYICIILSLVIFLCVDFLYFDFDFVCELIVSAPAPTRLLIIMDSSRVGKAGHVRLSANGEPRRGRESFPCYLKMFVGTMDEREQETEKETETRTERVRAEQGLRETAGSERAERNEQHVDSWVILGTSRTKKRNSASHNNRSGRVYTLPGR